MLITLPQAMNMSYVTDTLLRNPTAGVVVMYVKVKRNPKKRT